MHFEKLPVVAGQSVPRKSASRARSPSTRRLLELGPPARVGAVPPGGPEMGVRSLEVRAKEACRAEAGLYQVGGGSGEGCPGDGGRADG